MTTFAIIPHDNGLCSCELCGSDIPDHEIEDEDSGAVEVVGEDSSDTAFMLLRCAGCRSRTQVFHEGGNA